MLERAGREHVAGELEQFGVADRLAAGQLAERPAGARVEQRGGDVESVLVVDAAAGVGDSDDGGAALASAASRVPSRRCRSPESRRGALRSVRRAARSASSRQTQTPRPVASSRPSEPPTASGLPVTTLSTEWP